MICVLRRYSCLPWTPTTRPTANFRSRAEILEAIVLNQPMSSTDSPKICRSDNTWKVKPCHSGPSWAVVRRMSRTNVVKLRRCRVENWKGSSVGYLGRMSNDIMDSDFNPTSLPVMQSGLPASVESNPATLKRVNEWMVLFEVRVQADDVEA